MSPTLLSLSLSLSLCAAAVAAAAAASALVGDASAIASACEFSAFKSCTAKRGLSDGAGSGASSCACGCCCGGSCWALLLLWLLMLAGRLFRSLAMPVLRCLTDPEKELVRGLKRSA